jgi:hypothetical protein
MVHADQIARCSRHLSNRLRSQLLNYKEAGEIKRALVEHQAPCPALFRQRRPRELAQQFRVSSSLSSGPSTSLYRGQRNCTDLGLDYIM